MADTFETLVNDVRLRFPRGMRGLVGVNNASLRGTYFEPWVMLGLEAVLAEGDVFYDVGCSYGVVSCLAARRIGPRGIIHAFDANPGVLAEAGPLAALNTTPGQIRFHEGCIGEHRGKTDFFALPGPGSVASTRNPDIIHFEERAVRIETRVTSLDEFVAAGNPAPQRIKLDIEGSEVVALRGGSTLLKEHGPDLVIETHGLEIDGIGGNIGELCYLLEAAGYELLDLSLAEPVTPAIFSRRYRRHIGYVLAAKGMQERGLVQRIRRRWRQILVD